MITLDFKNKISPILKNGQVKKAAVFGSFARGQEKKNSDIDMLIEFKGKKTLIDLVRLKFELEKKIGKKIDLLTYKSLHPLIKDIIIKEQKIFYEEGL